jgi:hypothetical protein
MFFKFLLFFIFLLLNLYQNCQAKSEATFVRLRILDTIFARTDIVNLLCSKTTQVGDLIIRPRQRLLGVFEYKKIKMVFVEIWRVSQVIALQNDKEIDKNNQEIELVFSSWLIEGKGFSCFGKYIELLDFGHEKVE